MSLGSAIHAMLRRAHDDRERGSAALELVLVTPVLLVLLLVAVGLGRMAHARQQVVGAARDAARAASLERSPSKAQAAGDEAARRSLGDAGVSCQQVTVTLDLSANHPGGQIRATVACTASMRDLGLAGFPATRTFSDTAVVPIETLRTP
jgi:Flp pilus assembly protein TadG